MKIPLVGGCLCGSVRYEIISEPTVVYACHCADCQTASGSSFVLAMRVSAGGIRLLKGEAQPFERSRADGRRKNIFRCARCLTALWGARVKSPAYLTLYAGTLEDTSKLHPAGHIWTSDAQPWISIPRNVLAFEQEPPDMELLEAAWKKANPDSRLV